MPLNSGTRDQAKAAGELYSTRVSQVILLPKPVHHPPDQTIPLTPLFTRVSVSCAVRVTE
jgi:hypothetical protein